MCILDKGHFLLLDVDANLGMIGLVQRIRGHITYRSLQTILRYQIYVGHTKSQLPKLFSDYKLKLPPIISCVGKLVWLFCLEIWTKIKNFIQKYFATILNRTCIICRKIKHEQ
jgi:hypothetical protein